MEMKNFGVVLFAFVLCMSFASAGFFGDIFQKITGNVVEEAEVNSPEVENFEMISCEQAKESFNKDFANYEVPRAVPFKNDIFNVYVDDEFFVSAELVDKKIGELSCEFSDEATYNVYLSSNLIAEINEGKEEINFIKYYNEKRKNGELEIKAVGIGRKIKMGFINFGLKIASWFS